MEDGLKDAMSCPACGGTSEVYRRDAVTGWRYRRCLDCNHAFTTEETILGHKVRRYARRKSDESTRQAELALGPAEE